jgi:ArsR family transcriptional regulator, arsenate/arsenite/antimonite-responsive transcriptional repressor / arsenate reductase (thioredoxin)
MVELSAVPRSLEARAAVHAALADPVRLAIVDELVASDRSPTELGRALGVRSNLLAHHLRGLERAGVVTRRRSSGDRRRAYIHLVREPLLGLIPSPSIEARAVLFVCTHNSARSQLAAAMWNRTHGVHAESAGTHPAPRVHPGAVRVGRRMGLDLRDARPRRLDRIAADLVVTVCDQAKEELEQAASIHWSVPDPVAAGTPDAFASAAADIRERVDDLARHVVGMQTKEVRHHAGAG